MVNALEHAFYELLNYKGDRVTKQCLLFTLLLQPLKLKGSPQRSLREREGEDEH